MTVSETMANYANLPPDVQKHLKALEVYIGDTDGKDTVMWCSEPPNTCVDDGTIDTGEAVSAFNGIVAALTAALSDQVVVSRWLLIEIAPRDGTRILATGGGLGNEVEIVNYNERVGCWDAPNDTLDDCDDEPQGYSRPTQWQPLPAAPASPAVEVE